MVKAFRVAALLVALVAGSAVAAAQAPSCPAPGEVLLNEISYRPSSSAFIELWGPPGTSLECLELVQANGGPDGTKCDASTVYVFTAADVIGADGYFVLATASGAGVDVITPKANLQDGPDGVWLRRVDDDVVIDAVAWGAKLDACEVPVAEGPGAAPEHEPGQSIARMPDHTDTNDSAADWVACASPTPGAPNECPAPPTCDGFPDPLSISEVQVQPNGSEFVELAGPPGLPLDCYAVRGIEGGNAGEECTPEKQVLLAGSALDDQGLATVHLDLESSGVYGVQVVYLRTGGDPEPVAGLRWGGDYASCPWPVGSNAVELPEAGSSLSRCGQSGDDAVDYVVTAPTPGAPNACDGGPAPVQGCEGGHLADVAISEVKFQPNGSEFIELKGPPQFDLRCYRLHGLEGGKAGETCTPEKEISLDDEALDANGYGVFSLDLETTGAYGVELVFVRADGTVQSVDALFWGAKPDACPAPVAVHEPVALPASDKSLSRCWQTGDDTVDFVETDPTRGIANACPAGEPPTPVVCTEPPAEHPVINEIQTSVGEQAFIELYGPPGTPLDCYRLVAFNGTTNAAKCDEYARVVLDGHAIGDDGYFVVAPAGGTREDVADLLDDGADLQDGPDAVALVFERDDGQVDVVDSLVYGRALPVCAGAGVGEGDAAAAPGKGRALTRCQGADSDDNAADFRVCSTPTPGAPTGCACAGGSGSEPAPPTAAGGGGCVSRPPSLLGPLMPVLILVGLVMAIGRYRRNRAWKRGKPRRRDEADGGAREDDRRGS